jgi:hypothetical protein
MPTEWRLQVLETRIGERLGLKVRAYEVPYEQLPPMLVQSILDELVTRSADFPVVLVGDEVACVDGVDIDEVLAVVAAAATATGA